MSQKKIVVIGGGSGSATVLEGLKLYDVELTAIVNMADDGGSTGRLRQELGILPPGDIRQCLIALSGNHRLRDLFAYRFERGGLSGHPLGNLLLAAAESSAPSYMQAIEQLSELLQLQGRVIPSTTDQVTLCMDDGVNNLRGEFAIGHAVFASPRPRLWLESKISVEPQALAAIQAADLVVIAPGNLYGSLAPALLVPGIADALRDTTAKKVYVCNLTTKAGQSDNFSVHDYAGEVMRFMDGTPLDVVLVQNSVALPKAIRQVIPDEESLVTVSKDVIAIYQVLSGDIASHELPAYSPNDQIAHARSVIRHDPRKVATMIMGLVA